MDNKQITMYSTAWCGDCKRSKAWLDAHKIGYNEIDIEKDKAGMQFVQKTNNGMNSVPTIVFPDGSILVEPSNEELEKKVSTLSCLGSL